LSTKLADHPDKKMQDYLSYVMGGATRMSNLIFDLLEYSRIGKDESKSVIDCDKLVHEVLTDMVADIKENNAEIHASKLPLVNGYPYLKSLFQNLLSNAIKFHKAGTHPVIQISAIDKGSEFQFTIKDNGIGIEKIYYERIFIIFQRLHSRAEYEGTGIGLSQCKKIVELHGGKIWVESEPGKGSTFIFTIPKN
jgi:light-regulated signal transduction histidine kinase (bacteriophytochrome)